MTYLREIWPGPQVAHIWKVELREEWPQPSTLEVLPPCQELFKVGIVSPRMYLDLQLTDGQSRRDVRLHEFGQRVEFAALNVDFQHVDELVTIHLHERFQSVDGWTSVRMILCAESIREEMAERSERWVEVQLGAKGGDAVVVAPDLTVRGVREEIGFERRIFVDSKRVDDAGRPLGCNSIDTTYPLSSVTERTKAIYAVRAVECWDEKIPCQINTSARSIRESSWTSAIQSV